MPPSSVFTRASSTRCFRMAAEYSSCRCSSSYARALARCSSTSSGVMTGERKNKWSTPPV